MTDIDSVVPTLLTVPYDIRHHIYDFLIPVGKNVLINTFNYYDQEYLNRDKVVSCYYDHRDIQRIMPVCRQLNREMTPLLYGSNSFSFAPSGLYRQQTERFIPSLRASTKLLLKSMNLVIGTDSRYDNQRVDLIRMLSHMADLPKLKLTIIIIAAPDDAYRGDPHKINAKSLDDSRTIFSARRVKKSDVWEIHGDGTGFELLQKTVEQEGVEFQVVIRRSTWRSYDH